MAMLSFWRRRLRGTDDGFTLVEVVAALTILSIVSTAALYFFVGGARAVTHQQRSQTAVTVANEAMELVYGVAAKPSGGVSGVLVGRKKSVVQAQWSAATAVPVQGMDLTYAAWDPAATGSPAVKLSDTRDLSKTTYTYSTYIGTCYRPTTSNVDSECRKITGKVSDPGTAPTGYAQMLRVMVVVTWPATAQTCGASRTCSYQVSALVDPNGDLAWNNTTRPIAVDDVAIVNVGESQAIEVLRNDIIGTVVTNPVVGVTQPTTCTSPATAIAGATSALLSDGSIQFTAPTTASGFMCFTYRLKDGAGRESNTATVKVSVMPRAIDDAATGVKNRVIAIPVTTNDQGSPAVLTVVTQPSKGTVSVSGTTLNYSPGNNTGTFTFTYSFVDGSNLPSNTATVTVNVSAWDPPLVADLTIAIPATQAGSTADLNIMTLTGNPTGYIYEVLSTNISQGRLKVNGNDYNSSSNYRGTSLGYMQQGNALGLFTFTYRVLDPDGAQPSAIKTVTIVLVPTPTNDAFPTSGSIKSGATNVALQVSSNDAPSNFGGTVTFKAESTSTPTCGTLPTSQPDLGNGIFRYNAPTVTKTTKCTFTYVIRGTGAYTTLVSAPATVTITVTK